MSLCQALGLHTNLNTPRALFHASLIFTNCNNAYADLPCDGPGITLGDNGGRVEYGAGVGPAFGLQIHKGHEFANPTEKSISQSAEHLPYGQATSTPDLHVHSWHPSKSYVYFSPRWHITLQGVFEH